MLDQIKGYNPRYFNIANLGQDEADQTGGWMSERIVCYVDISFWQLMDFYITIYTILISLIRVIVLIQGNNN